MEYIDAAADLGNDSRLEIGLDDFTVWLVG